MVLEEMSCGRVVHVLKDHARANLQVAEAHGPAPNGRCLLPLVVFRERIGLQDLHHAEFGDSVRDEGVASLLGQGLRDQGDHAPGAAVGVHLGDLVVEKMGRLRARVRLDLPSQRRVDGIGAGQVLLDESQARGLVKLDARRQNGVVRIALMRQLPLDQGVCLAPLLPVQIAQPLVGPRPHRAEAHRGLQQGLGLGGASFASGEFRLAHQVRRCSWF